MLIYETQSDISSLVFLFLYFLQIVPHLLLFALGAQ